MPNKTNSHFAKIWGNSCFKAHSILKECLTSYIIIHTKYLGCENSQERLKGCMIKYGK